ncbi:ORF108 [Spodoptera frugiperda granulovirus]|uniref:ORF108 n=1 Tax=Spodoptera frugiperda granulovirus TaxID=307454 RepID=A0A0C5AS69_9BBAC|nr:ORF108 [Spodoptera frugiperda granulovirus]AJK91769.1 ORF108 [Spodoptera frugiperda granulovirus]
MSLQIFKDIIKRVPGLQASVIANNLKSNMKFLLTEHVKDKEFDYDEPTVFDKFVQICTSDNINVAVLYQYVKNELDLNERQFHYLYKRMKEDVHLNDIVKRLECAHNTDDYETVPSRVHKLITDNDYMYVARFLEQECNNAVKFM